MKPLARYTISQCSEEGFAALSHSVKLFKEIYPEFDIVICYNNLNKNGLDFVKSLNTNLLDQINYKNSLIYEPWDATWKLYPPRLRLNSHELIIDNDLILYDRLPAIDQFLNSQDLFIITTAHFNGYGNYSSIVNSNIWTNSGLIGLYPGYNLQDKINMFLKLYPATRWKSHNDDEAVLTYLMLKENYLLIPLNHIYSCNVRNPFRLGEYGSHFVSLNKGVTNYWKLYLESVTYLNHEKLSGSSLRR